MALAAGASALLIYITTEHFDIIPGTGALDEDPPPSAMLGYRSVAVLPEPGRQPDFLAQAVSLELARLLARVPEIEVISARSLLAMARPPRDPQRDTPPFDVRWLLEIRSDDDGEDARLSAALIEGDENDPRWITSRARPVDELAALMMEITGALASRFEFDAALLTAELHEVPPATYRDYLSARLLQWGGPEETTAAVELLAGVTESAPGWAPGWAARAHGLVLLAASGGSRARALLTRARKDLDQAESLRPDLPETHLYRSLIAHRFDWDWQTAHAEAQQALLHASGDAAVLEMASSASFTLGDFGAAVDHLRKAIALDPLAVGHRVKLALALEFEGRHQAAIDAYRDLMVFDPDFPGVHARLGRTLVVAGRAESALLHAQIEPDPFWRLYGMALALEALGRGDEAEDVIERLVAEHGHEAAVQIAEIHAFAGRTDAAFEWLARGVEQRDPGVAELKGNPLMENLRDDPGWAELLVELGLPED